MAPHHEFVAGRAIGLRIPRKSDCRNEEKERSCTRWQGLHKTLPLGASSIPSRGHLLFPNRLSLLRMGITHTDAGQTTVLCDLHSATAKRCTPRQVSVMGCQISGTGLLKQFSKNGVVQYLTVLQPQPHRRVQSLDSTLVVMIECGQHGFHAFLKVILRANFPERSVILPGVSRGILRPDFAYAGGYYNHRQLFVLNANSSDATAWTDRRPDLLAAPLMSGLGLRYDFPATAIGVDRSDRMPGGERVARRQENNRVV